MQYMIVNHKDSAFTQSYALEAISHVSFVKMPIDTAKKETALVIYFKDDAPAIFPSGKYYITYR